MCLYFPREQDENLWSLDDDALAAAAILNDAQSDADRLRARDMLASALSWVVADKREELTQGAEEETSVTELDAKPRHSVEHAVDFSWLIAGDGTRFDFKTGRQRDVVRVLYSAWARGGDGTPMTEAAMMEELDECVERLRVARIFHAHAVLNSILRRVEGKSARWALHLREPTEKARK